MYLFNIYVSFAADPFEGSWVYLKVVNSLLTGKEGYLLYLAFLMISGLGKNELSLLAKLNIVNRGINKPFKE
jgi:hypothetical protein